MPVLHMVQPSPATTVAFVVIVLALALSFVWAIAKSGPSDEPRSATRRWLVAGAAGVAAWLAFTGAVSGSGVLESSSMPPRVMFFMSGSLITAVVVASSRVGARLVRGLPIAALVGFQAFRLPLEVVLHQWAREGVLPVQMTFEGHNFDIVTGVLALGIGLWAMRARPPRWAIFAFNVVGLGLLITVATIATLSAPIPLRLYENDPPVLLAYYFPYGWIVPVCVAGALFGHVLVFRWLLVHRESSGTT